MSDLGDVGRCLPLDFNVGQIRFLDNIWHKNNPDAPLVIHAVSSQAGGDAFLTQGASVIDKVGIASNGDIFFYDVDVGTYYITTTTGSGEDWIVVVSETTTTASFTVAALAATQTVAVTSVTGLSVNQYIQVTDGTHTINGKITAIASLNLTVSSLSLIGGTNVGDTMASAAVVAYGVTVQQLHASNRASAYAFA
jgi:hypothetical protein